MSRTSLSFMGEGEPETFRCRVYGADEPRWWEPIMDALAGDGLLDAPAHDTVIEALTKMGGWLDEPTFEANPAGPGRVKRWRLSAEGRRAWEAIR